MPKILVTKSQIFAAANTIAASQQIPTIAAIRKYLGGVGSETTIHKYLKAWKQGRILKNSEQDSIDQQKNHEQLLELKQIVKKQQQQNEMLSQETLALGRENNKLIYSNTQLTAELATLKIEIKNLVQERDQANVISSAIVAERETAIKAIIEVQNQQILNLQTELSALHHKSLELVRSTSDDGHQALMVERVKNINAQEQIKILTSKINTQAAELKQALELIEKLKQKINRQAIEKSLEWDELKAKEQAYMSQEFAR